MKIKKYLLIFLILPILAYGETVRVSLLADTLSTTIPAQCPTQAAYFRATIVPQFEACAGNVIGACLKASNNIGACSEKAVSSCRSSVDDFIKNSCHADTHAQPVQKEAVINPKAKIISITGEIIIRNGAGDLRPVATGDALNEKDEVHTGPDSSVVVEFPDGHRVTLSAETEVKLSALLSEKDRLKIEVLLNLGEIRAQAPRHWVDPVPSFTVVTPTATMSVRGTIFTVAYDPKTQKTTVSTTEGEVLVTPTNTSLPALSVLAGASATVTEEKETGGQPIPRGTATPAAVPTSTKNTNLFVEVLLAVILLGLIVRMRKKAKVVRL